MSGPAGNGGGSRPGWRSSKSNCLGISECHRRNQRFGCRVLAGRSIE